MLKEKLHLGKTRTHTHNTGQDQEGVILENLNAKSLSSSTISLLHELLGNVIGRLRKHDPHVIQELRRRGYNTESDPDSEDTLEPVSKYRSPI